MSNKRSDETITTVGDFKYAEIKRRDTLHNLIKGVSALFFSSVTGSVFTMLIVMTPDPDNKINYGLAGALLFTLFIIFLYGLRKLDLVEQFLKKGK